MKKLSVFACLSFFALASFTTKSGEQGTTTKTEVAPAEAIAGQITILSIEPDGCSGIAVTNSGVAVAFINPLHLPICVGAVTSASITFDCPIIDPPVDPRKKKKTVDPPTGGNTVSTGEPTPTTYGVAIILSL